MPRHNYQGLLTVPKIGRWHANNARSSKVTADVYLRRLGNFCAAHHLTPDELVGKSESDLEDLLMDYVTEMEKSHAGSYIQSVIKAVKSWLHYNRREIKAKINIKGIQETPTLREERVPTQAELKRIFLSSDSKARAASALVSQSGVRIESIGNYEGIDGLVIKDFPEMRIERGEVMFEKVPTLVLIRLALSKARHKYFTFASEESCSYLKQYLEERMRAGENLNANSPVITPKQKMKPFIRTTNVSDAIRSAIRKAGLPWRPYVLRSYFDTQLMLAESKGLVLRDYRQFWMGHKGDIENRYTTNKGRLPEGVIEDMREAYKRSQEYLQTTKPEIAMNDLLREFKKQLLIGAGYKEEEIDSMDLSKMTNEEMQERVRERLLGAMINNGHKQRIVTTIELEGYLSQGWEFVASPQDLAGRSIIRLPPEL